MLTLQDVRRQQQLRTLAQGRLEHTKEMTRRRLHSLRAHTTGQSWDETPGNVSWPQAAKAATGRDAAYN